MRILLSNDDGFDSEGLKSLRNQLEKIGEVWTVAPLHEQSAQSHAFTLRKKLRFNNRSERIFTVDGTPADCVYVGLNHLGISFDAVVSGINHGQNLGTDIHYSGTVAAAREGCFRGVPSLAVSMRLRKTGTPNFGIPAKMAANLLPFICSQSDPQHTFFNLNVPDVDKTPDLRSARLGRIEYAIRVDEEVADNNNSLLSIGGKPLHLSGPSDSDVRLYRQGFATLTPLTIDSVDVSQYKGLQTRIDNTFK